MTVQQIANRDRQFYEVERIVSHRKTGNRYTFKVKWAGYDEVTEEPLTSLKNNVFLHDYLRSHNLQFLLPAAFRK